MQAKAKNHHGLFQNPMIHAVEPVGNYFVGNKAFFFFQKNERKSKEPDMRRHVISTNLRGKKSNTKKHTLKPQNIDVAMMTLNKYLFTWFVSQITGAMITNPNKPLFFFVKFWKIQKEKKENETMQYSSR